MRVPVSHRLSIAFLFLLLAVASGPAATTDPYLIQSGRAAHLASADNVVYYGRAYREFWRTDGTTTGTVLIRDVGGEVKNITPAGDLVFFTVADSQLWVSDGTTAGTQRLRTFVGGIPSEGYGGPVALLGGTLFFAADDGTYGMELWKSDGTPSGTVIVKNINPQAVDNDTYGSRQGWSVPSFLTPFNGVLYFRATDGTSGHELWRSDGTASGTVMVRDIRPGYSDSSPSYLTVLGGLLLFAADDGPYVHGSEIWRSDGTTAGTTLVCDCEAGVTFGWADYLTLIGSRVWFVRRTNAAGDEPWVTDGTAAGTYMVKDIYPGTSSGTISTSFVEWGGRAIFTATDGVYGSELWSSDGTAAGTSMIRDVNPGGASGSSDLMARTPNGIYFRGYEPGNGYELWRSDGTEAGTTLVANLETSGFAYGPSNLTPFGSRLVFTQNDNLYGLNSCAAPGAPTSLTAVASATSVSLNWTATATAVRYDIYRSPHDCPGSAFEKIAESITNSYVDATANDSAPAAYKVLAVNADGCESLPSACAIDICTIPPPGVSLDGASSACGYGQGGTATVDAVSDTGMQYQWAYRTTSGGTLTDIPVQTTRTYTLTASDFPSLGTYFLVCRTTSSCAVESVSNEVAVAITSEGAPPVISTFDTSVCPGAESGAMVMGTYSSYQWSIINGTLLDSGTNSSVMFAAGTTDPVALSVTVVDNGGCTATSSIEIPLRTIPPPSISTFETSVCPGAESGAMVMESYSAHQWSITNGTMLDSGTNSSVMFAAGSSGPVRLTVTVTDSGGCLATNSIEIPLRTIPPPVVNTGVTSLCPSEESSAMVEGTYVSYQWSIQNGTLLDAGTYSSVMFAAGSTGPVRLTVAVVDNGGCAASTTVEIPMNEGEWSGGACVPAAPKAFTVTSRDGMNRLQWLNSRTTEYATTILRYRTDGVDPASETDGLPVGTGEKTGASNTYDFADHMVSNGTSYRYAAFIRAANGRISPGRTAMGRAEPLSATKWIYNTGATAMTAPGIASIFAVSNDRILHSIQQGVAGGDWAPGWRPFAMNGPSQARPSVVSMNTHRINGAPKVAFIGSQDGYVYAVNAATGAELWGTQIGETVQTAPSVAFREYGIGLSSVDLVIAGTRNTAPPNGIYALNTQGGAAAWLYTGGGTYTIGVIGGQVSIDYPTRRVYFASRAASAAANQNHTLWCLSFDDATVTRVWSIPLGDIDGSPVVRNGTLYVGTNNGTVYAVNPNDGTILASFATNDGPIKGFPFPNSDGRIYFSTTNKVWSLTDSLSAPRSLSLNWSVSSIAAPSTTVLSRGSLYVGSSDGRLYKISQLTSPTPTVAFAQLGSGLAAVGTIGYDYQNDLAYVGTAEGAIYAVSIP